jgi:hypothetical protein
MYIKATFVNKNKNIWAENESLSGVENSLELWSKSTRENAFSSSREVNCPACLELFTEPDK